MHTCFPSRNDITVAFKKDDLPRFADGCFGLVQIVQNPAFVKQSALRGIQVFRLTVSKNSSGKSNHLPCAVRNRKNDTSAKAVNVPFALASGRQQSALLHLGEIEVPFVQELEQGIPAVRRVADLELVDHLAAEAPGSQIIHGGSAVFRILQQKMIKFSRQLIRLN
ncbi:hypothetical protein D3C73_853880 [compost metagenome]